MSDDQQWPTGALPDLPAAVPRGRDVDLSIDPAAFLQQIEELQNSGDYDWASGTLEGIYATVEEKGYVTPGQQTAIDNIEEGGRRGARTRGW